jgi:hypothetical protein
LPRAVCELEPGFSHPEETPPMLVAAGSASEVERHGSVVVVLVLFTHRNAIFLVLTMCYVIAQFCLFSIVSM